MHPDGKTSAGCFFYGLGQHKPAEKDSGIHNNRMVKERAHNMSVQQGMNCACAAVLLPVTRPPLVSHNLGSMVSLQLNCVWLPSTVMRPMTGTVPSFFTT